MNGVLIGFAIIGIMSTAIFLTMVIVATIVTIQDEKRYRKEIQNPAVERFIADLHEAIQKGDDGGVY